MRFRQRSAPVVAESVPTAVTPTPHSKPGAAPPSRSRRKGRARAQRAHLPWLAGAVAIATVSSACPSARAVGALNEAPVEVRNIGDRLAAQLVRYRKLLARIPEETQSAQNTWESADRLMSPPERLVNVDANGIAASCALYGRARPLLDLAQSRSDAVDKDTEDANGQYAELMTHRDELRGKDEDVSPPSSGRPWCTWRIALLVLKSTDARGRVGGRIENIRGSLTQEQINDTVAAFEQLPRLVSMWSSHRIRVIVRATVLEDAVVRKVEPFNVNDCWCTPEDIPEYVEPLDRSGEWDTIAVTGYWGEGQWWAGLGGAFTPNGSTYMELRPLKLGRPVRALDAQVMLHEWLHGAEAFFNQKGFAWQMPLGGADGATLHGYVAGPDDDYGAYYWDHFHRSIRESGQVKGYAPDVWQAGTPRTCLWSQPTQSAAGAPVMHRPITNE